MSNKIQNYLDEYGFIPVAAPMEGIAVLDVLHQDPDLVLHRAKGKFHELFVGADPNALPFYTQKNMVVGELSGSFSLNIKGKASLGFLEKLISSIGIKLGFKFALEHDEELVFFFENPVKDEITSVIKLDTYLNQAEVIDGNFGNKLQNDEIFVITALVKSSKFAIGIVNKTELDSALNLPSIKDFVEGEFTLSKDRSIKKVVQYTGDQQLVFGVQAAQIQFERTFWQYLIGKKGVFKIIDATGTIMKGPEKIKANWLKGVDFFLED